MRDALGPRLLREPLPSQRERNRQSFMCPAVPTSSFLASLGYRPSPTQNREPRPCASTTYTPKPSCVIHLPLHTLFSHPSSPPPLSAGYRRESTRSGEEVLVRNWGLDRALRMLTQSHVTVSSQCKLFSSSYKHCSVSLHPYSADCLAEKQSRPFQHSTSQGCSPRS